MRSSTLIFHFIGIHSHAEETFSSPLLLLLLLGISFLPEVAQSRAPPFPMRHFATKVWSHHHDRGTVHILPREMLGRSTFGLCMWLLKWLPMRTVDHILLLVSRVMLGDTQRYGLRRPRLGPLELKSLSGKTPVLDVGALAKIKSGDIKVCPAVKRLTGHGAEFVDGRSEDFDAIILATGYKSNVASWLKETEFFSDKDGFPRKVFPDSWKGEQGLYAVGFTRQGLMGASVDAKRIAHDIKQCWMAEPKQRMLLPSQT